MKTKRTSTLLLAAPLVGLVSAQALAGNCDVLSRAMTNAQDIVVMSCKHNTAVATVGEVGLIGNKITRAHLVSGGVGSSAFAATTGLDAAGNVISSCTVQDFTFGGDPPAALCPSGVRWVGTMFFPE